MQSIYRFSAHSEALSVNNGWARLIVLTLGDPHLLEGAQRRQDRASNPDRILALRRSDNLDFHGGWCERSELLGHALTNASKHGGASRQDDVAVEILANVNVTLHDGLESGVVDTTGLLPNEAWLEEHLRATEALTANGDDVAIRKLVCLLLVRALGCSLHFCIEVQRNVAQLFLDVTDNLTLGSGGKGVTTLCQDLHEVLSQVTASKVETENGVRQCISLVDWDSVRDTVTRVHDNTCGTARGVKGQHSLDGNIHGWGVEGLKHDLCHALSVGLWVQRGLSEKHWVLLRGHTQLVVE